MQLNTFPRRLDRWQLPESFKCLWLRYGRESGTLHKPFREFYTGGKSIFNANVGFSVLQQRWDWDDSICWLDWDFSFPLKCWWDERELCLQRVMVIWKGSLTILLRLCTVLTAVQWSSSQCDRSSSLWRVIPTNGAVSYGAGHWSALGRSVLLLHKWIWWSPLVADAVRRDDAWWSRQWPRTLVTFSKILCGCFP